MALVLSWALNVVSKKPSYFNHLPKGTSSDTRIINNNDSLVVDLKNATLTATYIDIPIFIKSDDVISSFDFELQFNLAKLTYSSAISLTPSDPTLSFIAFFSPTDLYLRYSSFTFQSFPSNGIVHVTKIRFSVNAPCTPISLPDFSNLSGILNGTMCSVKITTLDFSKFIPVASYSNTPVCLNTTVLFSSTSSVTAGSISSWLWKFSNGTTSNNQSHVITYTTNGTASSTLIVTSSAGCKDSVSTVQTIGSVPVSNFTYTFNCIQDTVFFTNTSTIPTGSITGFKWYFDDNTPISQLINPAHHYSSSGNFKVKLTTTSNLMCSSSITLSVLIRPADFNKDGITDVNDFLIFAPNYGTSCNQ